MNHDEHQRERMRAWARVAANTNVVNADNVLEVFDARFPAPAEQADDVGFNYKDVASADVTVAELATLRDKARYWDAMWPVWYGQEDDAIHAARKVIDAGALK